MMSQELVDFINSGLPYSCLRLVYNQWDSEILQQQVYTLCFYNDFTVPDGTGKAEVYEKTVQFVIKELELSKTCMISAKVPACDSEIRNSLDKSGFKLIECYVELEHTLRHIPPVTGANVIKPFHNADIPLLEKIAFESFTFDRFHMDLEIKKEYANISRSEWVKNACLGRADFILVAEADSRIIGFVIGVKKVTGSETTGRLDLIAVDRHYRKLKVGYDLTVEFLTRAKKKGYNSASVGTQAHNIPSLRLYEKTGFLMSSCSYTYHKHITI